MITSSVCAATYKGYVNESSRQFTAETEERRDLQTLLDLNTC